MTVLKNAKICTLLRLVPRTATSEPQINSISTMRRGLSEDIGGPHRLISPISLVGLPDWKSKRLDA